MRFILHVLASLLVAGIAYAGQVSPLPPDEVVKIVEDKKLDGLKKVWKELGIESEQYKHVTPDRVERFDEEIDGRKGIETLVRVSDFGKSEWQYLIFSERGKTWFFLGNIDIDMGLAPVYRVIRRGNGTGWLVIASRDFWGTGTLLYKEHWWDLSGDELKEVLEYPVEGYVADWGMVFDRKLLSRISGFERHPDNKFYVYMEFWAIYYNGLINKRPLENVLFAVTKRIYYVWDPFKGRFVIDPKLSDMTQEQVDGLFNDDNDRFLKHNFEEIKKLASSKEESKREWLKRFLQDCKDGPEKTALLELLR